ncbi:RHS repeat-associated core domain-containing protein [Tunicatimonas pelagia]|uniref:RHS repeat-associated core domain-containing protein n=1 Tax=Tunicatimonas pelagia TaxID=931531 RepID=UPI002667109A|nr:RHS repeat-associated core domain-containing protein [Tunicatimonas pelagia]WKN43941.1 RHS repeat-associated core domain-containing protein [Tunicatimonas pelagia]
MTDTYLATMEIDEAVSLEESQLFANYDQVTFISNDVFDYTNTGSPEYSLRLSGASGEVTGLAKSLRIRKGDKVNMEVYATYGEPTPTSGAGGAAAAAAIVNALMQTPGAIDAPGSVDAISDLLSSGPLYEDQGGFDDQLPKAFLNYIFVGDDFINTDYGFVQVSSEGETDGINAAHEKLELSFEGTSSGYLYVYLSNESNQVTPAYFDDFKIEHEHSLVIADESYYPFGLTHTQPLNDPSSKYLYNGFELQDELSLDLYDYQARFYDPVLGRFINVDPAADLMRRHSPYNYAFDNPIRFTDPDGMLPQECCGGPYQKAGGGIRGANFGSGGGSKSTRTYSYTATDAVNDIYEGASNFYNEIKTGDFVVGDKSIREWGVYITGGNSNDVVEQTKAKNAQGIENEFVEGTQILGAQGKMSDDGRASPPSNAIGVVEATGDVVDAVSGNTDGSQESIEVDSIKVTQTTNSGTITETIVFKDGQIIDTLNLWDRSKITGEKPNYEIEEE